jgi:hypothetical protein
MSVLTRNKTRRRLQAFAKQWENTTCVACGSKLFWHGSMSVLDLFQVLDTPAMRGGYPDNIGGESHD